MREWSMTLVWTIRHRSSLSWETMPMISNSVAVRLFRDWSIRRMRMSTAMYVPVRPTPALNRTRSASWSESGCNRTCTCNERRWMWDECCDWKRIQKHSLIQWDPRVVLDQQHRSLASQWNSNDRHDVPWSPSIKVQCPEWQTNGKHDDTYVFDEKMPNLQIDICPMFDGDHLNGNTVERQRLPLFQRKVLITFTLNG